jgi:hypothetical protein
MILYLDTSGIQLSPQLHWPAQWISDHYENNSKAFDLFCRCRGRVGIHPAQLWQGCLERVNNV